ncbi:Heavy metal RND efflux outer membrane protein, CzcC family [Labilithrix luteola]|uniref:Heavy metal RND efflux outer membrane protein, CzcC family n=1 Tax=Labilithrix luteola TaxID=1391654 RepID=A0A0K1PW63_9BACT|nr:TolC family protein [Labilithrix luteola]AKU97752.1 Heavy metal RND efflux outer membrane protein, CzcC family [Labilithrix luteola]
MQFCARALVLGVLALPLVGCVSSSKYDSRWVSSELGRMAGHDVPLREAPQANGKNAFVPSLPHDAGDVAALTEDGAVSVALWNSAQFRADLAQLGIPRAELDDASALPNPNFSFLFPISSRQLELSIQYPISQLVQRPWRIAAAKYDVERTARSLLQNGLDAVRDVRIAWAELEAAKGRRELRRRAEDLLRQSSKLAASRFGNGDISRLEADLVEAEALAAGELSARSVREEGIARTRLRQLLGLAESPLGDRLDVATREVPKDAPVTWPSSSAWPWLHAPMYAPPSSRSRLPESA